MQRRVVTGGRGCSRFQSSSGPRTGCNEARGTGELAQMVSILIRSEDRMQPRPSSELAPPLTFQSSSGPRTGCNNRQCGRHTDPRAFQSSSGPRTGCNAPVPARRPRQVSFNPHPVRGPDATPEPACSGRPWPPFQSSSGPRTGCNPTAWFEDTYVSVSILIRSEDRMQRRRRGLSPQHGGVSILIRSEDRMQQQLTPRANPGGEVSILIRSEDRMQLWPGPVETTPTRFNPHPVRGPDATAMTVYEFIGLPVSILIRSEDRMQRCCSPAPRQGARVSILIRSEDRMQQRGNPPQNPVGGVSILIRSEDRMQRSPPGRSCRRSTCFNPHPVRGPDATGTYAQPRRPFARFNPHPVRGPDATMCSSAFQSSSGPRTGCNEQYSAHINGSAEFQSSSGPRTGCNRWVAARPPCTAGFNPHPVRGPDATERASASVGVVGVSILIRSEDRMQRPRPLAHAPASSFQSSSGPRTGCNGPVVGPARPGRNVSILIRSEDRMQQMGNGYDGYSKSFQSSSGPRTGCN